MQIQVNTDNHVQGDERLAEFVQTTVGSTLERFASRITRIEVHLSDENADKGGLDKRCLLEARVEGRAPTAVSHVAASVAEAVEGAAVKMASALDSALGRLRGY